MKLWICILIVFALGSCENNPQLYEGEEGNVSGIYFQYYANTVNNVPIWQDSMIFSFQNLVPDIKETTVNIPVKILGYVSDQPRPFQAKVIGGTAVEGEDYLPLEKEYLFPVGSVSAFLPIVLKRTDKLQKQAVTLDVELVENDYFKCLVPNIEMNEVQLDATRFRVVFSEIIKKPFYWLSAAAYFGDFSVKKFNFLNAIMGWTTMDWKDAGMEGAKITRGKFNYAATLMKKELQRLADLGTPVYEEDGETLMQLGANYKVDYSK